METADRLSLIRAPTSGSDCLDNRGGYSSRGYGRKYQSKTSMSRESFGEVSGPNLGERLLTQARNSRPFRIRVDLTFSGMALKRLLVARGPGFIESIESTACNPRHLCLPDYLHPILSVSSITRRFELKERYNKDQDMVPCSMETK